LPTVNNGKQGLGRDLPTVKATAAATATATTGASAGDDSSEISDMTALKEQQQRLHEDDDKRPTTAQAGTDVSKQKVVSSNTHLTMYCIQSLCAIVYAVSSATGHRRSR
jgi:hypothetical protein